MTSFSSIYRSWSRWRWPATLGSRSAAAAGAGRRGSTLPTAIERLPAESADSEQSARADHDRAERVLGEEHRQARLLAEQRIEALRERAAAREHDAAVGDVAGELGGRTPRSWWPRVTRAARPR